MSINKKCNFSFQHYGKILRLAKKQGYRFCFFSELPDKRIKRFYMRHDVDLSLEKALRLAQIERQNKVVSTFFVRLNAPFFNIFDSTHYKLIKEILKLGHQIGIHLDVNSQKLTKKSIEEEITRQFRVFEDYFNFSVEKIVSFHRPTRFVLNKNFKSDIFINVYNSQFFSKIKYLSDSRGKWKEGCVCKLLESSHSPLNLQVLTHPIWWGRKHRDSNKSLAGYLKEKVEYLDESLTQDSLVYQKGSLYKVIKKNR